MWCDVGQSCAMMGLQATAGKRKLEGGVGCMDFDTEMGESPAKLGRVEGSWWAVEDSYTPQLNQTTSSYYDMEVSGPCPQANPCQPSSLPPPPPSSPPAASTLNQTPSQQQQQQQQQQQHYYHHHHQRGNANGVVNGASGGGVGNNNVYGHQLSRPQPQWGGAPHHYEPPMIRREENGKSYLELGSSYRTNDRCCEGSRSSWCRRGRACYRQRRLAVLNISMCKLARYRQYPDPSLHRSVLICNTLRHLEREMERDRSPPPMEPVAQAPMVQLQPTEQGRLTPFPIPPSSSSGGNDGDSGIGDSDDSRSINWGSVLSLSSQSPLDPLNNNELLDVDIGPELDLDFMPGWKLTPLSADDILRSTNAAVAAAAAQESNHHHNHYHLHHLHHHHHHHQLSPNGSTIITSPISSSCNGTSPGVTNTASTTHVESLMCVGS